MFIEWRGIEQFLPENLDNQIFVYMYDLRIKMYGWSFLATLGEQICPAAATRMLCIETSVH